MRKWRAARAGRPERSQAVSREIKLSRSYVKLCSDLGRLLEQGRQRAMRAVAEVRNQVYWEMGQRLSRARELEDRRTARELMDNLAADYVRTAVAKGLPFRRAVFRHALRNSLIPIATSFGNNVSVIVSGSFLIEKVFNINGMGLLGYESVVERDYPVVLGLLVVSSLLFLVGNILSDLCVAVVDPRVRFD